jgi:hypothetical protein
MINSKTKTFGFFFSFAFSLAIISFMFIPIPRTPIGTRIIFDSLLLIPLSIVGSKLWRDAKKIQIDTRLMTIQFEHLFTNKKKEYNLNNLDGYYEVFQPAKGGSYRVLYLSKDGIFVEAISSFIYSNMTELEEGLKPVKFLGRKEFDYIDSIKILFKQKIL